MTTFCCGAVGVWVWTDCVGSATFGVALDGLAGAATGGVGVALADATPGVVVPAILAKDASTETLSVVGALFF